MSLWTDSVRASDSVDNPSRHAPRHWHGLADWRNSLGDTVWRQQLCNAGQRVHGELDPDRTYWCPVAQKFMTFMGVWSRSWIPISSPNQEISCRPSARMHLSPLSPQPAMRPPPIILKQVSPSWNELIFLVDDPSACSPKPSSCQDGCKVITNNGDPACAQEKDGCKSSQQDTDWWYHVSNRRVDSIIEYFVKLPHHTADILPVMVRFQETET